MISVEQAFQIISENIQLTDKSIDIDLIDALGYVLFQDVLSPINMPPFRQSAMDGYAINLHDAKTYALIGEVKAGDGHQLHLKPGDAVRIFTGAPVPNSANAVVMQEKISSQNHTLIIDSNITINENIRPLGEQVLEGQVALKKGVKLTAAAIAYLTTLGITQVKVYKKPSIAIVVTGNELVQAGQSLQYGQIYESNAIMLISALNQAGYSNISTHSVNDHYEKTFQVLKEVIYENDVVLVSGGISVGDYDFVGKALEELEVIEHFYKVNQKPGKPLFFGKKDDKIIFALPGNPAASLSCFYIYVIAAIEKLSGNLNFKLNRVKAVSKSDFIKKGERAQFLKAIYKEGTVEILEGQNSSMLHTFALANSLVYVAEKDESININDKVEVILLPIN
ncbi:MAG: molybdopterin molybdotransferase MoeA [Flavobacteriaceae bacterium]|nr:molybdopterin molybdotransferase MoeA [Flavobacteriaceae bacterium]